MDGQFDINHNTIMRSADDEVNDVASGGLRYNWGMVLVCLGYYTYDVSSQIGRLSPLHSIRREKICQNPRSRR